MSEMILVMGKSGSGKSTSTRNLPEKETIYIQTVYKPLPFQGWKAKYPLRNNGNGNRVVIFSKPIDASTKAKDEYMTSSKTIVDILKKINDMKEIKYVVIDDSQYLMAYESLARVKEKGFDKFTDLAYNFFSVITTAQFLREDLFVFFLHHTDESDSNNIKAKTIGKMIDNTITLEGIFTYVLLAQSGKKNGKLDYYLVTNSDGNSTAKSPMGMFEYEEPNDLKLIADKITKYNEGV